MSTLDPLTTLNAVSNQAQLLSKGVESILDYGIFLLDPAGHILTWNEGAKTITGYQAEEITGQHFSIFYSSDSLYKNNPAYELAQARQYHRYEEDGWRIRKDGSRFWANIVMTALIENDELLGFIKVIRDLTEKKQAEEALRQTQERFRLLVNGAKDYAIFMLDPEGYVSTWNEGAKAIKGYESDEIIGQHFSRFYPQEALDRNFPAYELEMAKKHGRFEDEGWRLRKDGSAFWANVIISSLYNSEQEFLGFAKVTRDLTERKKIIDELESAKNRAETMNAELESFSYSISHDLRAPLRSIDGFTQVLLLDKSDQLDEEAKDYLQRVLRNAQQMNELILALLNLSRLSRLEYREETVNLGSVAQSIITTLKEQNPNRAVGFRIHENLQASADPVLIRSVLENLLSNAFKFTNQVENPIIEFGSILQGDETWFFIRDNGAGFDAKLADKLFGPFQRLHDAREYPGSGIGLATVKRIIHRHGGRVWAEAVENEGATFYFTLAESQLPST